MRKYPFSQEILLNTYYVTGTILGTGEITVTSSNSKKTPELLKQQYFSLSSLAPFSLPLLVSAHDTSCHSYIVQLAKTQLTSSITFCLLTYPPPLSSFTFFHISSFSFPLSFHYLLFILVFKFFSDQNNHLFFVSQAYKYSAF